MILCHNRLWNQYKKLIDQSYALEIEPLSPDNKYDRGNDIFLYLRTVTINSVPSSIILDDSKLISVTIDVYFTFIIEI